MSVLSCNRSGCDNIMCDMFSYKHGYICNECYDELNVAIYYMPIDTFMCTKKGSVTQERKEPLDDISTFECRD